MKIVIAAGLLIGAATLGAIVWLGLQVLDPDDRMLFIIGVVAVLGTVAAFIPTWRNQRRLRRDKSQ